MENLLFQLNLCEGIVIKRPSQYCKTPYVADVMITDNQQILGHSPALGCCGLSDKNMTVLLSELEQKKNQTCSHRIELAKYIELDTPIYIGINPKLGEKIAEECLSKGFIKNLDNVKKYAREVKILNSRFDFAGIDKNDKPFILEIKNVPLADYVDVCKKDRENYNNEISNKKWNEKISYFPDGYRKKSTDVVSPRALKHIQELEYISKSSNIRTILCFIIQRNDVSHFQTSNIDLTYKDTVYQAWKNGVEINTLQVEWNENGQCKFVRNDLPISLKNGEYI